MAVVPCVVVSRGEIETVRSVDSLPRDLGWKRFAALEENSARYDKEPCRRTSCKLHCMGWGEVAHSLGNFKDGISASFGIDSMLLKIVIECFDL